MKTLLITAPMPEGYFSRAIRQLDPAIDLVEYAEGLGDAELAEVDAVLAWRLPRGLAPRLPRLRWVRAASAGVDKLLVPDLPPQVMVSRIVDAEQAEGIAQFVVLMWDVPGITITPHIAAQSSPNTIAAQFVAGLRCLERGAEPPNRVDRARGY
jgi:phosphoglycerate dehydrogenase-like enzyme